MVITIILVFIFSTSNAQLKPKIEFTGDKVVVSNLDQEVFYTFLRYNNSQQDFNDLFPVRTEGSETNISGEYKTDANSIWFVPRFPFAQGVTYVSVFYTEQLAKNTNEVYLPAMDGTTLSLTFNLKPVSAVTPQVVSIFPSADILPENLLRFHILFSTPMTTGNIYKHVKLLDDQHQEVEKAFLIIDQEFWDEEMTHATLLLDPGRIKRGLRGNLDMKSPLLEGKKYTLVVSGGWKDGNGTKIIQEFKKEFICSAADRQVPDISTWKVTAPTSFNNFLLIQFPESLDATLLENSFRIKDNRGEVVSGRYSVSGNETAVTFQPEHSWNSGMYTLDINPKLEDLAGNNLNRLFDTDLKKDHPQNRVNTSLTFKVSEPVR